jgi:tRNA nucleotidyltransferase (CCA-adding enzyme)
MPMTRKLARDVRIYEVGGAVRDALLGRPVADRDWVVVGATPEMMLASGYRPVGSDFPVFLHPETQEEHALARTERKHGTGYRGFEFFASPDVTLEEDLARRDLTINAMARDEHGVVIDPYHGREDLARGVLRHVSPAFAEDPLRVLRVARFAARFGFRVAPGTRALMRRIVLSGELATLAPERVWRELALGLAEAAPSRMIGVLRDCGALVALLPEVDALFGVADRDVMASRAPVPRRARAATASAGTRVLRALDYAARQAYDLPARYATLVQKLGLAVPARRAGHAATSQRLANAVSARFKAPLECRDAGHLAARFHGEVQHVGELRPAQMLDLVLGCDALRRPQRLEWVVRAAAADACATARAHCDFPQAAAVAAARDAIAGVDAGAIARAEPRRRADGADSADDIRRAIRRARLAALAGWKRGIDAAGEGSPARKP